MNPPELFPLAAVQMDSPRLAWMKREGIITYHDSTEPRVWYAGFVFCDLDYASPYHFFAREEAENGDRRIGFGDTEGDAVLALCLKMNVKLWNEESPYQPPAPGTLPPPPT